MNARATKLRLGPLPKNETVRFSFNCTKALQADLERYAALHAQAYGESVDAATMVPHMLEAFMARDREFKTRRATHVQQRDAQATRVGRPRGGQIGSEHA